MGFFDFFKHLLDIHKPEKVIEPLNQPETESIILPSKQTMPQAEETIAISPASAPETKKVIPHSDVPFYISCDVSPRNRFIFLATLDLRTCPKCAKRDLTGFSSSSKMPPCHPGCRCTTMPGMSPTELRDVKRWARDPVTGKSTSVPGDMKYSEWHRIYVETNSIALANERTIQANPNAFPYQKNQILHVIQSHPGILQSKLADYCPGLTKSSIYQNIKQLVASNQIYRKKHGNTFELYITDKEPQK